MIDWTHWNRFLDEVNSAKANLGYRANEESFFRGQSDARWPLQPSLFRGPARSDDAFDQLEYDLFFEFDARARELHTLALSQWDILFYMRHHGVPTRLLDWTETLGVAVYFALHDYDRHPERQPCVWVLNPYRLNESDGSLGVRDLAAPKYIGWDPDEEEFYDYGEILVENEGFGFDLPVAIYPQQRNARMGAQQGWFTCHGDAYKPLDQLCQGEQCVAKVEIPIESIPAARDFFRMSGLDDYRLFPDLDGLSRALGEKYGFTKQANVPGESGHLREARQREVMTAGPRRRLASREAKLRAKRRQAQPAKPAGNRGHRRTNKA